MQNEETEAYHFYLNYYLDMLSDEELECGLLDFLMGSEGFIY